MWCGYLSLVNESYMEGPLRLQSATNSNGQRNPSVEGGLTMFRSRTVYEKYTVCEDSGACGGGAYLFRGIQRSRPSLSGSLSVPPKHLRAYCS